MTTTPHDPADESRHAMADEDPSHATVHAVAEVLDCDPLDLPPLARTIDPDSLDTIVNRAQDDRRLTVVFEYSGCAVSVTPTEVRASPD